MTDKIPCEVIRDLLPSYVDGLTSEKTNEVVENHVEECADCKTALDFMREGEKESGKTDEKKEIDFLKKTRRKKTQAVVISVLTAVVILFAAIVAKVYFIGSTIDEEFVSCRLSVSGKEISVGGDSKIRNTDVPFVNFEENDGVVTVSFRSVRESRFHTGGYLESFTAENEIKTVKLDARIVWNNGKSISGITSDAFKTRHLYVGAMPENSRTAAALGIYEVLGTFTNALKTSQEPYSWTMIVVNNIGSSQREAKEEYMRAYGYAILALIDNLSEVKFEYEVDGEKCVLSVDTDEASDFAGENIKEVGKDITKLQTLIEKTVLCIEKGVRVG
ncbi:MAG: DUF4825 domain-containing protein [Acutalibacteraceae bacterium]